MTIVVLFYYVSKNAEKRRKATMQSDFYASSQVGTGTDMLQTGSIDQGMGNMRKYQILKVEDKRRKKGDRRNYDTDSMKALMLGQSYGTGSMDS